MTIENMTGTPQYRRGLRGFALAWTVITIGVGVCTFIAIYAATGITANASSGSPNNPVLIAAMATKQPLVPTNEPTLGAIVSGTPLSVAPVAVALQVTATNVPATAAPVGAATNAPAAAQAVGSPTLGATIPAINDTAFDLGVQVQENPDSKTYDIWMQEVRDQLKLNWLKYQVRWADLEKVKGTIDFGTLDNDIPLAAKYHVKVLISVVTAPRWAREKGASANPDHNGPPGDPQDYVNFVTAIIKKYPGAIHAVEVWNEQNLDREWDSPKGLQAAQYVALLSAAYKAVKAIDPNILILSGALSPVSISSPPQFYDDFVYMDALIKAGMLNFADCVGAHHNGINLPPTVNYQDAPRDPKGQRSKFRGPYDNPHHEWSFKSTLEGYEQRIKTAGSTKKICVTEFGWPSMQDIAGPNKKPAPPPRGFEFAADNTLADEADYTDAAITEMINWGWIQLAFVWNLNYGAQIGWDPKNDNVPYSILGPGFVPRPVWQKIVDRNFSSKPRTASP